MRLGYDLCEVVSEDIVGIMNHLKRSILQYFNNKVDDCTIDSICLFING